MSEVLSQYLALADEAAELAEINMAETGKGGRELVPEAYYLARLVAYYEYGKHAREYKGVAKDPTPEVRLGFMIFPQGGTPTYFETFGLSLGNNEKAKAKIAFDRLNYAGKAKHFAQLLNVTCLLPIKIKNQNVPGKNPYNIIDYSNILSPFDPVTNQPYPIPEVDPAAFKLFLWDRPTLEGWDSLEITGTNDQGESKNYKQELCTSAVNFEGSALHHLLLSNGRTIPVAKPKVGSNLPPAQAAAPQATPQAQPQQQQVVQAPDVPQQAAPAVPTAQPAATVPSAPPVQQAPAQAAPQVPNVSAPVIPGLPSV